MFPVTKLWTLALNAPLTVPPAYDGTLAFFSLSDDRLAAYDIATGEQRWLIAARPLREPAAGDGLLFVVEPDGLTARSQKDGAIVWQQPLDGAVAVPPVWDNGWLIIASASGSIQALRASDGHVVWSRDVGSPAHAAPTLAADRVYVPTTDKRVVALRVDTGEPVWERKLGGAPFEILALDERAYVGASDNYFYCVLTKDGAVDWRWRTGGDVIGRPVFDDHNVFFVALDNVLRALDRKTGGQRWMRPLPLRPTTGPAQAGGTLVVTGLSSAIQGYKIRDGVADGDVTADGDIAAPPHVFRDAAGVSQLLFVSTDLAKGATATLVTRRWEPEIVAVAPLPGVATP